MDSHIYLVGLGIRGLNQLTREAEAALRRCSVVYFSHAGDEVEAGLRALGPETVDLHSLYDDLKIRTETYEEMARLVLDAAGNRPPVALAMYGHPMVYVDAARRVLDRAPALGFRVEVIPGVSSLDTLFADLRLDPALRGLQVYEATALLLYGIPLVPEVPCFIFQPGAVESATYFSGRNRPERFLRLKEYLLRFYPGDHQVRICTSAYREGEKGRIRVLPLGNLEDGHADLDRSCTLYVPARGERAADPELLDLFLSKEHARSLSFPSMLETARELQGRVQASRDL